MQQEIYKKITTNKNLPSSGDIIFNEIADILSTMENEYASFRDNFYLNERQEQVFRAYLESENELQIYLLRGGTGSGKTICALGIIVDVALRFPGAQILVSRRTYTELEDSVIPDIRKFLDTYSIGYDFKSKPAPTFFLHNTSKIACRSEIRSYTSGQDKADSLGSTKYVIAYLNEVDAMSMMYLNTLTTRMRQRDLGTTPLIICDCNPPSEDSWVYKYFFTDNDPNDPNSNVKEFYLPIEDNVCFVGQSYIDDLKKNLAKYPTLYRRFVEGKFAPSVKGEAIFKGIFNRNLHVSKVPLQWDPMLPIYRGWDFGYVHPATVFFQYDLKNNEIRILKAVLGSNTLIRPYAQSIQRNGERLYPGASYIDYGDPAGNQHTSTGNDADTLRNLNPPIIFKSRKSTIDYGLNIMQKLMTELSYKGSPILQINNINCDILIDALEYGYTHADKAESKRKIVPYKDGYYEHVVDAIRYGIINVVRGTSLDIAEKQRNISERWTKNLNSNIIYKNKIKNVVPNMGRFRTSGR